MADSQSSICSCQTCPASVLQGAGSTSKQISAADTAPKVQQQQQQQQQVPFNSRLADVRVSECEMTKDWHRKISNIHRNYIMQKLFQVVYSALEPQPMTEETMQSVVLHTQKIEIDAYKSAHSWMHYGHIIAEHMYKIQQTLYKD